MHLSSSPADFACNQQDGPMRFWVVLYRSVYSLVSFTAANAATCIAPGWHRFRGRCGHAGLARPMNVKRRAADALEFSKMPVAKAVKPRPAAAVDMPTPLPGPDDEDVGIESEPGDTERDVGDPANATVAGRVRRNLLPCWGEIKAGEVWARTADWRGMFAGICTRGDRQYDDLKVMSNLMDGCVRSGLVHPRTLVSAVPYCGSCGRRREAGHETVKERAVLCTHHPTAPAIEQLLVGRWACVGPDCKRQV
eukprot:TRINITY_DN2224_c0_g1_i1.p1 TRINITY_DN2224_c0_g1~~TRINITY_DN2224_c0_g1_i1.p1  ORF type:complete len:251 (-),score=24.03 TRINITY_DN2224_c0_g1_i1:239-991(-)